MPKSRVQVADLRGPEQAVVTAPVHDNYAGISQNAQPSLHLQQLVGALSKLEPTLTKYAAVEHQEMSKEEYEKGRKARLQNALDWKQAVKDGRVPEGASPWFQKGYKEQSGRMLGYQFDNELRSAYAKFEGKDSDDPKVYQGFVEDFRKNWLESNLGDDDIDLFNGFAPLAERSVGNLSEHHSAYTHKRIASAVRDNTYTELGKLLDDTFDGEVDADPAMVAEQINYINDTNLMVGLPGTVANEITVDAIVDKAVANADVDILRVAEYIKAGTGKLNGTRYAQEKFDEAETKIARILTERENRAWTKKERVRKESSRKLYGRALEFIMEGKSVPGAIIKLGSRFDKSFAGNILSVQKNFADLSERENVEEIAQLRYMINHPNPDMRIGAKELMGMVGTVINKQETFSAMMDDLSRVENRTILDDDFFKREADSMYKILTKNNSIQDAVPLYNAQNAYNDLVDEYAAFLDKEPDATPMAKRVFLRNASRQLLELYVDERTIGYLEREDAKVGARKEASTSPAPTQESTPAAIDMTKQPLFPTKQDMELDFQAWREGKESKLKAVLDAQGITDMEQAQQLIHQQLRLYN